MIGGMAIAVEPAPAGGELTAVRALGRLRRAAPGAVNTAMAAVALVGAGIVVAFNGGTDAEPHELLALVGLGLATSTCAALGALILAGRPRHRLGLALLIGGAVSAVWLLVTAWADVPAGSERPLVAWAAWLDNWIFVGLIVLVTWPLLLFPDGALPSRRWRPIGALLFVATAAVGVAGMLDPGTLDSFDDVRNPLGVPESWTWVRLLGGFGFGIPVGVVAGMLAVQRQARARPGPGMRAALWASRALAVNFVLVLALDSEGPVYAVTLTASIALFAAAATVAVLRDRVIEVDIVLRRAFMVAGVAAASLVIFLAVFAVVTALAGSSAGALGGGLAVALVAVPLRALVGERVDSWLYGHRDPSTAVARFSEQLELADEPTDALPGVARALRETLGASSVLIDPASALVLAPARSGAEPYEPVIERALQHRGTFLGRLVIGARAPGESYGPADLALTEVLVRQVALVLDALRMAAALQQSREAIVSAREEERRRLRRELHDGLGSALAGIALTLQAARNTGGPEGDELVEGAREQTQAAVADVRRLVRGLRPPMLEDLGLTAALRAHADRLGPLKVEFELPHSPIPLPAAVELALYRIATEALTNVVRHAHARHCRVCLRTDGDEVALAVVDDGHGLANDATPGVGLRSMRERAAELGGHVELATGPSGGLAVNVRVPCATAPTQ
jgi:two-component system NarL family sensor kinase